MDSLSLRRCRAFDFASCQLSFCGQESSCAVQPAEEAQKTDTEGAGSAGIAGSKTCEFGWSVKSPDAAMSSCCASVRGDASRNEAIDGKQDAAMGPSRTEGRGDQYRRRSGSRLPFRLLVPLLIVLSIDAQVRRSCQQPFSSKSYLCYSVIYALNPIRCRTVDYHDTMHSFKI